MGGCQGKQKTSSAQKATKTKTKSNQRKAKAAKTTIASSPSTGQTQKSAPTSKTSSPNEMVTASKTTTSAVSSPSEITIKTSPTEVMVIQTTTTSPPSESRQLPTTPSSLPISPSKTTATTSPTSSSALPPKSSSSSSSSIFKRHKSDSKKSKQMLDEVTNELVKQKLLCDQQSKNIEARDSFIHDKNLGLEAVLVLFKYLAEDMDAFRTPELKVRLNDLSSQLNMAQQQLDGAARLQKALEINMKIMKEQHQVELTSMKNSHEQQLKDLEMRLKHEAELDRRATIEQHRLELENIQAQAENLVRGVNSFQHLSEMKLQHDSEITTVTQEYENKLEVLKSEFTNQLEALKKSYESRINNVTKHYEEIKEHLNEKNVQLHNDYQDLMRRGVREGSGMSTPTSQSGGPLLSHKYLEQEVDSLRAVMELRNQEINQLRIHNNLMEKQLEEIPKAQLTINSLQQKIENLEAIINLKADYEKDLAEKHNVLLRKLDQESRAKKRLSMNNEELAFRLSQTLNNVDITVDPTSINVVTTSMTSSSSTSSPSKYTNGARPKSMIATITTTQQSTTTATVQQLPPTSPSNKTSNRLSGPPISAKPTGIKLRRPQIFSSKDDDNKQDTEIKKTALKPSDV